ncbi:MAG TPA: hypothetical protein VD994_17090, partial [Prosthecobacter sp.]|nr:hypothetical protein [Prosthecobacter sp.]
MRIPLIFLGLGLMCLPACKPASAGAAAKKAELPEAYGIYVLEGEVWRPVGTGGAVSADRPQFLVFDHRIAGLATSIEETVRLKRQRMVTRIVEEVGE